MSIDVIGLALLVFTSVFYWSSVCCLLVNFWSSIGLLLSNFQIYSDFDGVITREAITSKNKIVIEVPQNHFDFKDVK